MNLKNKIEKILKKNTSSKSNISFGNYLLAKFAQQEGNHEIALDYLTKGHQHYFDAKNYIFTQKNTMLTPKNAKINENQQKSIKINENQVILVSF